MPSGYVLTNPVRMRQQVTCRDVQQFRLLSQCPAQQRSGLNFSQTLIQICAEVSGASKFDYSIYQLL
jgi:hypothetical protein